jgi:SAM-dependent methyltransferase
MDMMKSIEVLESRILKKIEEVKAYVKNHSYSLAIEEWKWLEQFAKGEGINICCGDYPIANSTGVDLRLTLASFEGLPLVKGDELPIDDGACDYILTNYLETFSNPVMVLREWRRVLKKGGVLAIVARDAADDRYKDIWGGVLKNRHRFSCFTKETLKFYLQRAGFHVEEITPKDGTIRAVARNG